MDKPRNPTQHCKEYVGAEWMNPSKKITKADLLHFLEHQIKWRKMTITNNFLINNEYIQTVFREFRPLIPVEDFPSMIEILVEPEESSQTS